MLSYLPFLKRLVFKKGLPLQLVYFVTSRCNASCKHCFYWSRLNSGRRELTLQEVERVAEGLPSLLWLSLTGGEPFLRSDLAEVARLFYRHSRFRILTIPTNGYLTQRVVSRTRRILESCPDSLIIVSISLDGLQETHDRIRQVPGGFEKARRTFSRLKQLKNKHANFGLVTTMTCTPLNQEELSSLYTHLRDEWKPDNIGIGLLRGNPYQTSTEGLDIRYYREVNALYEQDMRSGALSYYNSPIGRMLGARELQVRQLVAQTFEEDRYLTPCYAGSLSAVLLETGEVRPCEILNQSIGNISDHGYDFAQLWNSARARQVRSDVRGCFCTHECAMSSNVAFNLRHYPALMRRMWQLAV